MAKKSKEIKEDLNIEVTTEIEQVNIVNNLFACKETTVSPFQKPTFITISGEDLDKKFTL
jgi:DNA mismatch repair protein MutL